MYKDVKFRKERKQAISRGLVDSNLKNEKYLNTLQNTRDFSYEKFNQGKLWFESGLSLEDADEALRNNMAFIKGYNHGKRLDFINSTSKKSR